MSYMDVPFPTANYLRIRRVLPDFGNHILATYNSRNIILYIAVPRHIGAMCSAYQTFRKNYNHLKINWWLTTTFLNVVHQSNWASLPDQDCILAVTVTRRGFEELLEIAANSRHSLRPQMRFEWENERDPFGFRIRRSAMTLKLKSPELIDTLIDEFVLRIDDVTSFVRRERNLIYREDSLRNLLVPHERVFEPVSYFVGKDLDVDRFADTFED